MAQALPFEVDLTANPETNFWRRTYIPVGEDVSYLKSVGDFTDKELETIQNTPFLASRIQAASQVPTPIGWNDFYKGKKVTRSFTDARQAYNFAANNPDEFLRSEFPAYLAADNPEAATSIVQELSNTGLSPDEINTLYDTSLPEAPKYAETFSQFSARKYAENQGPSDPLGKVIKKYIIPIATTVGAIAGGPVGAAVANSIAQLGETGKVDPVQTAIAAGSAYVGQELLSGPAAPEMAPVDSTLATSTPAPGSFQAALPELGVQTAATTPGATLLPGSFQAALPSLIAPVNVMGDTAQGLLNQDLEFVGADAEQLYDTTGSVAATQQNLIAAGVDPTMAAEASDLAALGGNASSIAANLGQAFPGEVVFTSEGLLSGGATLDEFAKDIADISSNAETLGIRDVFDALRRGRSIYNLLNPPASGQAVGGGLVDDSGFQPQGVQFPLGGMTDVQRTALPSLGPVISPYISQERLNLLSQPYQNNLLGYQPNFSLLG